MKNNFLFFLILTTASFVYSQNATLSPYSYFSVGKFATSTTVENTMMGGMNIYADSTQFSLNNPATLAKLEFVQYRVGVGYRSVKQTAGDRNSNVSTASLNYLALSIPTKHFAFSFGLRPKSNVGYRMKVIEEIDGLDQSSFYQGSGGVNSTFLGFAFNPIKGLSLGVSAHYNFGLTEKSFTRSISGVQLDTQIDTRSELSGVHYVFGMHYEQKIASKYYVQAGLDYTPLSNLQSTNSQIISTLKTSGSIGTQEQIDLGSLDLTTSKLGSETNFGIGFGIPQKWFIGASFFSTNRGLINPLETSSNVNYVAASRLNIGGFYIPNYDSFTSYFSRIVYRAGIRLEETGVELKNQHIKDFGITFGIGLPMGILSKINIGVELGRLGTTNAGLVEEDYANIMLGFSLSDVWFIKRKYD